MASSALTCLYLMDNGKAKIVSFGDEENGFIVHAERK